MNSVTDNGENNQLNQDDMEIPEVGMTFNSEEEVSLFYKKYANEKGFDIMRRRSKQEHGVLRYLTLACAKSGKPNIPSKNSFQCRPSTKTDCKAKINATLRDGLYILSSVELQHNHEINPLMVRFYKGNKHIDNHIKKRLELNDQAGIPVCKNFNVVVEQAGGYENLSCDEKSCRNYIDQVRRLKLREGDAEAVHKYFVRMRKKNPQFYHVLDVDQQGHLQNVFWADARSRAAYESFGDVVCFDSTYLTNKYDMPFAPFVGVNHHGQSILLGCGLLSSESIDNYVWLFEAWLECMCGRAPAAIITDQCKSIKAAVAKVFPNTFHGLCRWHIMNKVPHKLSNYREYDAIKSSLHQCIYDSLNADEFESLWSKMINTYNLEGNEWLRSIYEERKRWVSVFTKKYFLAGMSSSQRSESMNSFFDGYINSRTSLKQFVEQYEKALKRKIEKEAKADFDSFNTNIPLVSKLYMESQLQKIYTNDMFKKFQEEIKDLIYCSSVLVEQNGTILTYVVRDWKDGLDCNGKIRKEITFGVTFDAEKKELNCDCCSFEFRGILCSHALCVFMDQRVTEIPPCYILARWRKDIKRPHNFVRGSYDDLGDKNKLVRYNQLYTVFNEAADIGSTSEYLADRAKVYVGEVIKKLVHNKEVIDGKKNAQADGVFYDDTNEGEEVIQLNQKLLSPLKVSRRGRPTTKRKVSVVEKFGGKTKRKVSVPKKATNTKTSSSQVQENNTVCQSPKIVTTQLGEGLHTISGDQSNLANEGGYQGLSFTQLLQGYEYGVSINAFGTDYSFNKDAGHYSHVEEPRGENEDDN